MKPKHFDLSIVPSAVILKILLLTTLFCSSVKGQSQKATENDIAKKRLLIHISADYLYTISQGQIDMDSAVRIPCRLNGLSLLLPYNEGYSDGKSSEGSKLLDAGKLDTAKTLLNTLKGEARIELLLEISSYLIYKPGTDKADLNEAKKYLEEILKIRKFNKWRIEASMLQANLLHQLGENDLGQKLFSETAALCERSGNTMAAARAFLEAGKLLRYGHPSRLLYFEKALSMFQAENVKTKEIETLSQINVEYFIAKRYDDSEKLVHRIIALQNEIGFRHQQFAYDVLSYLYLGRGDFTHSLHYSNRSIQAVKSIEDAAFLPIFYNRKANLYTRLEKNEEALVWFDKALKNSNNSNKLFWYKAFLHKAQLLMKLQRYTEASLLLKETSRKFAPVTDFEKMNVAFLLGENYRNLKKEGLAEKNYKQFLEIAESFPIEHVHEEFPHAYFQISDFYLNQGKTVKARELLGKGITHINELGPTVIGIYYKNMFKVDSIEHKYNDAIKHLQLSHKFIDAGLGIEERKKVEELLLKYETEKKDKNIKLLHSQKQVDRLRFEESEKTKNIILTGAILLIIIIGLLFNRYLIKQRSNRKLEAHQRELDQKNTFLITLNAEQDKLLKEKEWLIKEVHHRVKNNLQMVTSLLYSQSVYLKDDAAKLAIKDSLRRMQAMALIHQKLYQDENTSTIAMPEYIKDLIHYLNESFETGNQITFKQNIEMLDLDVSQAIPLGLIVTESIVNAIKYAFFNEQKGVVTINMHYDGPDHLRLEISDNGIGFPLELENIKHNSLGLDLMQGLAKQLNGVFTLINENGVKIIVRFPIVSK